MFVPVKSKDGEKLMPTTPARARKWIKSGKATPYFSNGIFCIRLNVEPSGRHKQEIAVGVDPGSKKEGFTVKSESHTYLNVQADAHTHTAKKVKNRRELRRGRRSRKCPNRNNYSKAHNYLDIDIMGEVRNLASGGRVFLLGCFPRSLNNCLHIFLGFTIKGALGELGWETR